MLLPRLPPTCIGGRGFVVDPSHHFDTILCSGDVHPRDTGNEVLQGNTALVLLHQLKLTELGSITIRKAGEGKKQGVKVVRGATKRLTEPPPTHLYCHGARNDVLCHQGLDVEVKVKVRGDGEPHHIGVLP